INGDFLCVKGRYAFDFADDSRRLREPLIRRGGRLVPATWNEAIELVGTRFREIVEKEGGQAVGVIGSTRTTTEEAYLLQKFARAVLGTNNIDHHRTADYPGFVSALQGKDEATASMRDVASAPAMLLIGNNPTDQHPLLAWQIRNNVRLNGARLYVVNSYLIKLRRQATVFQQVPAEGGESLFVRYLAGDEASASALGNAADLHALRDRLEREEALVVMFGAELRGVDIQTLVQALPKAKFLCLGDYANSRGAADMGLYPDLLPGYTPLGEAARFSEEWSASVPAQPGLNLPQMFEAAGAGRLKALYVVGSNPVSRYSVDPHSVSHSFLVVQDMFLTETAMLADVVLPAANAYEKSGTVTNTSGDLQILKKAGDLNGTKSDFEIIVRIADKMGYDLKRLVPFGRPTRADMGQSRGAQSGEADRHAVWLEAHGLEPRMSPFDPVAMLDEIQRLVPGYDVSRLNLAAGNDEHTSIPARGPAELPSHPELIVPSEDTLFTSGTLGRYSNTLNSVMEARRTEPASKEVEV
ncbi:MAG: molybdopterin oxidoreductase family protein, partial [Candidatus Korobacteraceae bacterium]